MVKRKNNNSTFNKLFGKRFGLADVILIALVVPYIYLIYKGIVFEQGLLAVYQKFIAPPLAFLTIGKLIIQNLVEKAKK